MKKIILTYGLIAGLVIVAMFLVTFSVGGMDFKYGELIGYTTMIIAFASIFVAVKTQRDTHLNGSINFKQAFTTGLKITLVASVIYVIAWMIMSNTIAKDFMTDYYNHAIVQLNESDLSDAQIEKKIAQLDTFQELYKNPFYKMGMTFLEIFPVGFVVSLIAAFILKRK